MSNDATSPDHGFVVPSMRDAEVVSPRRDRVAPWIVGRHTDVVMQWMQDGLGAVEVARMLGERDAVVHAEMAVCGQIVLLFDSAPDWPRTLAFLRLYVPDARGLMVRAVEAGGRQVTAVSLLPFGDLVGRVADPAGNVWWLHEHVEDVSPEELTRRLGDPHWQRRMNDAMESFSRYMREVGT